MGDGDGRIYRRYVRGCSLAQRVLLLKVLHDIVDMNRIGCAIGRLWSILTESGEYCRVHTRRDHMVSKCGVLVELMLTVSKYSEEGEQQMKHSSSSCRSKIGSSTAFPFPLSFDLSLVPEDSGNMSVVSSCAADPDFSPVISTSSSSNEVSTKSSSPSLSGTSTSNTSSSSSSNGFPSSDSSSVELTLTGLICRPLAVRECCTSGGVTFGTFGSSGSELNSMTFSLCSGARRFGNRGYVSSVICTGSLSRFR